MTTSLIVPLAYITVLVTSLAIFSRVYRRRKAAEKTSFEPWFPTHPTRDIYITLLSAEPSVPDNLLKSALLVRATADVRRIWRLRDDKQAITNLHQRGLIGDDTMSRFNAAEKELEAEIVDVVSEANTFRQGWGQMIFGTATEMAHAERTRDTVMSIPRLKAAEEKRLAIRRKYLPESSLPTITPTTQNPTTAILPGTPSNAPVVQAANSGNSTPSKSAGNSGDEGAGGLLGTPGVTGTPSKNTPNKKKKGGKK